MTGRIRFLVFLTLLGLTACQQPRHDTGAVASGQSCEMAARGEPGVAAYLAIVRKDYRLLTDLAGGEGPYLYTPGARRAKGDRETATTRANNQQTEYGESKCSRVFAVQIDKARSPGCCDVRPVPDACGVKQLDYAEAYNTELIRSPAFVAACGRYDHVPGLRD